MPISIGYLIEALIFVVIGASAALPLLLLNVKVAPRLGLIDWPKARGVTEEQTPIVGHSMVLITIGVTGILMNFYPITPWFLVTALVMATMGHLDDRSPLPPLDKFFFQVVCAVAVVYLDPTVYSAVAERYGSWGTFLSVFFLLGLVNAINFIDGIDGLAGIIIMVGAAGAVFLSAGHPEQYPYVVLASIMMGMMVPFLYLNVIRRKGFLGNVGSYFFSYVLGMIHLGIPLDAGDPLARLSLAGLCFIVPIADGTMVVLSRALTLRSPFQPDKGHLHHRLVQTSLKLRYILLTFGIVELFALGLSVALAHNEGARKSLLPLYVGVSFVTIATLLILLVEKASRRRVQSYFQRLDGGHPIFFIRYIIANNDGAKLSKLKLQRLEARIGAEIRVTDLCFTEAPNVLFVTLRTLAEPLKGIAGRIEAILHSEGVFVEAGPIEGEYVKVDRPKAPLREVKSA